MSTVLVVAAHPDDEILGPGGTIAKHVRSGDEVYAAILGQGQASRLTYTENDPQLKSLIEDLHNDTLKAAKTLGIKEVFFKDFPDNAFDSIPRLQITKAVEELIDKLKPSIIYTHHGGDLNVDHRRTFEAVLTASRPMEDCPVKEIYSYPTLSSSEWVISSDSAGLSAFTPNVFVNISEDDLAKKLKAMECYTSELRSFPHPRSLKVIEAECIRWGSVSGYNLAEAFSVVYIKK